MFFNHQDRDTSLQKLQKYIQKTKIDKIAIQIFCEKE